VDAWILTAGVKTAFGPFYVNAQLSYIQNPGDYGITQDNLFLRAAALAGSTNLDMSSFQESSSLGSKSPT
jgi:hypothetical protein